VLILRIGLRADQYFNGFYTELPCFVCAAHLNDKHYYTTPVQTIFGNNHHQQKVKASHFQLPLAAAFPLKYCH